MAEPMPRVEFKDSGWDTASGEAGEAVRHDNIILDLFEHAFIDNTAKIKQFVRGCNSEASEKHKCRNSCTCARLGKGRHLIHSVRVQGAMQPQQRCTSGSIPRSATVGARRAN